MFNDIADDSSDDERVSMTDDKKKDTVDQLTQPPVQKSNDVRKSTSAASPSSKNRRTLAPQWSRSGNQSAAPLRLNATKTVGPTQGKNGYRGALNNGDHQGRGWNDTGQRNERKKIQRFTPQELVAMYKPSDFKPPLRDLETLLTSQSQPPLSQIPLDQQQVRAKWEAHYANRNTTKRSVRGGPPVGGHSKKGPNSAGIPFNPVISGGGNNTNMGGHINNNGDRDSRSGSFERQDRARGSSGDRSNTSGDRWDDNRRQGRASKDKGVWRRGLRVPEPVPAAPADESAPKAPARAAPQAQDARNSNNNGVMSNASGSRTYGANGSNQPPPQQGGQVQQQQQHHQQRAPSQWNAQQTQYGQPQQQQQQQQQQQRFPNQQQQGSALRGGAVLGGGLMGGQPQQPAAQPQQPQQAQQPRQPQQQQQPWGARTGGPLLQALPQQPPQPPQPPQPQQRQPMGQQLQQQQQQQPYPGQQPAQPQQPTQQQRQLTPQQQQQQQQQQMERHRMHVMQQQQQYAAQQQQQPQQQQISPSQQQQPPFNAQQVPPTTWFYTDPHGTVQGPFQSHEIRDWWTQGYFKDDLPISRTPQGPFLPLAHFFRDSRQQTAPQGFMPPSPEMQAQQQQQQQAQQQQQQQRQQQQMMMAQQQAQQQQQQQQQAAAAQAAVQQQQAALRQQQEAAAAQQQQAQAQAAAAAAAAAELKRQKQEQARLAQQLEQQKKEKEAAETKRRNMLKQKANAEKAAALKAKKQLEAQQAAEFAAAAAAKAKAEAQKPAWGGAATKGRQSRGPSMAEVQAEEKMRSKQRQTNRKNSVGGGTTMAERIAAKNGGGNWAKPDPTKQTAHLKSLLGVETPPVKSLMSTGNGNWNGEQEQGSNRSASNPAPAKKSLLQIQSEESHIRAAQESAQQGRSRGGAGSWGAVAASGIQQPKLAPASQRNAVARAARSKQTKQPKASPIQTRQQQKKTSNDDSALWNYQDDPSSKPEATGHQPRAAQAQAKDFGGQELPPGMKEWASGELKKIRGNRDLTLVHFCMTLTTSSDIREYMREFLGSTPAVSSFASEFIKRKRAAKKSRKGKR